MQGTKYVKAHDKVNSKAHNKEQNKAHGQATWTHDKKNNMVNEKAHGKADKKAHGKAQQAVPIRHMTRHIQSKAQTIEWRLKKGPTFVRFL